MNIAYLASFNKMYLSKDVFLIPYYLAQVQGEPLHVVYGSNLGDVALPSNYRNAEIIGTARRLVTKKHEILDWLRYILPYYKNINSVFFCGCSAHHMLLTRILLWINPKVSVVVFGDMEEHQALDFLQSRTVYGNGIKAKIKGLLSTFFFNHVTFTVANEKAYSIMEEAYDKYRWNGLVSLYPCLDDELFRTFGLKYRSWHEKENIMICVGRIGNHQKNTEMMLEALAKVNLKGWKVYMIGPITDSFELGKPSSFHQHISMFYKAHPQMEGNVVFTGMIYDQKELFDYYLRAKVYLSSSRHEGFANAFSQAAALGCYIISTDVGGAETASNHWKYGTKVEQEDAEGMANAIQKVINDELSIDYNQHPDISKFLYSHIIEEKLMLH